MCPASACTGWTSLLFLALTGLCAASHAAASTITLTSTCRLVFPSSTASPSLVDSPGLRMHGYTVHGSLSSIVWVFGLCHWQGMCCVVGQAALLSRPLNLQQLPYGVLRSCLFHEGSIMLASAGLPWFGRKPAAASMQALMRHHAAA